MIRKEKDLWAHRYFSLVSFSLSGRERIEALSSSRWTTRQMMERKQNRKITFPLLEASFFPTSSFSFS